MSAAPHRDVPDRFDATEWLNAFASNGGWWAPTISRLCLGWRVETEEQMAAARAIYREVQGQPDRLEAVRIAIEFRCPN